MCFVKVQRAGSTTDEGTDCLSSALEIFHYFSLALPLSPVNGNVVNQLSELFIVYRHTVFLFLLPL